MFKQTVILSVLLTINAVYGYNLSPIPNFKIVEPELNVFKDRVESSYFGFAVTLRENSIMIGAPRAQSSLESQSALNQTGAVYKCNVQTGTCNPFIFDPNGNVQANHDNYAYTALKKDHQYLGMAMDGLGSDSSRFVACAPNIITDVSQQEQYLYHGVCYITDNTEGDQPVNNYEVQTLRMKGAQINSGTYYYMFGQLGFSVNVAENSNEILFGAPGILNWRGSVFVNRQVKDDFPSLQKRSISDQGSSKRVRRQNYYRNIVVSANPNKWNKTLGDDSYFGYAVSSGKFNFNGELKLLYVASAPRANDLTGEVVIFDYESTGSGSVGLEQDFKKYRSFTGHQMGENFGYALVIDDFNGDGANDLAISAPFHRSNRYDDGCVYVYLNEGDLRFKEQQNLVGTDYDDDEYHGQFGMSLAKIGDINQDGYADLAVGAPYENGIGAVYIFVGSINGIIPKYTQKLTPPSTATIPRTLSATQLFGIGLSRGVDIDGNSFNDLAVGAANIDTVYVYKSYPSIKIISTISSPTSTIEVTATSVKIQVCLKYSTIKELPFTVGTQFTIKLDPVMKRAKFSDGLLEKNITIYLTATEECSEFDIQLKSNLRDVFVPLGLELHHTLLKDFKTFEEYCTDCVALNPFQAPFVVNQIPYNTGCKTERCVSNLRISAQPTDIKQHRFVLGSSKSISIEYTIQNFGEVAYMTEVSIELPPQASFYARNVNCKQEVAASMSCLLGSGLPLFENGEYRIVVSIETSRLEPGDLVINANVTNSGDESDFTDNVVQTVIACEEFSDIEIIGSSSENEISVEKVGLIKYNVTQRYEIRNFGPSTIRDIQFSISIPIGFYSQFSSTPTHLVESGDIKISGQYDNLDLHVKWTDSGLNGDQHRQQESIVGHLMGTEFDTIPTDFLANEQLPTNDNEFDISQYRNRRLVRSYNRYTRQVTEYSDQSAAVPLTPTQKKIANYPHNRLIYFNCTGAMEEYNHVCVNAFVQIKEFKAVTDKIAIVLVQFSIDLQKIDRIYTETNDMFVMALSSKIIKTDDVLGKTIKVTTLDPFIVITKYIEQSTPIWLIIVSTFIGLLILILITYVFYRMGFFKRTKKDEMAQMVEKENATAHTDDDDDVNETENL